ncbi:PREDICTED: cysteine-rich receptor-like protein kinase 14 [Camelina sativa]|uniref:Cysteine-rich receptor-like protein kinase 14 n=1 Tax=Camelina sativa TaxID=90675 RepID=A0ABM0UCP1_CAMSA|nr:PREDICTED: cysteine-rich receptor-like protein kinase 14 [Camelina sativa]
MKLKNLSPLFWFLLVGFPVVFAPCGKTGFFKPNQQYDINRRLLLSSLASNVSARGGFYNASVGQGPDRVYAVGMCIQGAEPTVCSNCIDLASNEVTETCTNQTEGLVWPENGILCMVRYSNRSFFGSLEMQPKYILYNVGDIKYRSNLTKFDTLWEDLTSRMIARATSSSSERKYYAAEAVPLSSIQNIYALMQCIPIISLKDCNICLSQSVRDYQSCCHGKQGGIVFRPSCVFRWEIYPFSQAFNLTLAPPAQTPTSIPPYLGHKTNTTKKGIVVAIVVPTIIIIFLALLGLACFTRKMRKSNQKGDFLKS